VALGVVGGPIGVAIGATVGVLVGVATGVGVRMRMRKEKEVRLFRERLRTDEWVALSQVQRCTICRCSLPSLLHKHHCRMCGIVVCRDCVGQVPLDLDLGYTLKVLICRTCMEDGVGVRLQASATLTD